MQGDSGHAQVNMVTDVYRHVIDENRKKNAAFFEEAFYGKKNLNPKMEKGADENAIILPESMDVELLGKVLANPEMVALLSSLAKNLK